MRKRYTGFTLIILGILLTLALERMPTNREENNLPARADSKEVFHEIEEKGNQTNEDKKEVRQNQKETDSIFYDSTTSPKEMTEEK